MKRENDNISRLWMNMISVGETQYVFVEEDEVLLFC